MRRACLLLLIASLAGLADARPRRRSEPTPPQHPDLWQRAIEPHGVVVHSLLAKAREAIGRPDQAMDGEWAVDQRTRFFTDAFHLLRAARKLSPDNLDVLSLLGQTADEIGKTRDAIDALSHVVKLLGPDKAPPHVVGRLGAIELRRGNLDAAIRWLRYAQPAGISGNAEWLVYLSTALALRGEVVAAAEVLQRVVPSSIPYFNPEATLVAFALAVLYDRDEQRAAAFHVLDHMQVSLNQMYSSQLEQQLSKFRFAPGEDRHYYLGLFYESTGEYIEARSEFALYAASGDTPWRGRALDHIAAIDKQRRDHPGVKPNQLKTK